MPHPSLLIVDDDLATGAILTRALQDQYAVTITPSAKAAMDYLTHTAILPRDSPDHVAEPMFTTPPDMLLINVQLPDDTNGVTLLRALRPRRLKIIMMTALPDMDITVEAMRAGALYVVQKNFDVFALVKLINALRNTPHPDDEVYALRGKVRELAAHIAFIRSDSADSDERTRAVLVERMRTAEARLARHAR